MQSQFREPRSFTFEDPVPYGTGHTSHHGSDYTLSTPAYPQYEANYYVASASVGNINDASATYYRSVSPLPHGRHRSSSQHRYYSSEGMYTTSSDLRSSTSTSNFIPTPSDMANSYNNYSAMTPRSPTIPPPERYATTLPYPSPHALNGHTGPLRPRISTSRPRSGTLGASGSATSPTGERFPCEKCGKTFSRSHDRKRHHETQHLATPIIHRCRYCEKEFSRADSLKRHIDNGCDEAPDQRQ